MPNGSTPINVLPIAYGIITTNTGVLSLGSYNCTSGGATNNGEAIVNFIEPPANGNMIIIVTNTGGSVSQAGGAKINSSQFKICSFNVNSLAMNFVVYGN
jgi:hypothetical protein